MIQFSATKIIYDASKNALIVAESPIRPMDLANNLQETAFTSESSLDNGRLVVKSGGLNVETAKQYAVQLYTRIAGKEWAEAFEGFKPESQLTPPTKSDVQKKQTIFEFA